jgi:hypothetical protein
VFADDCAGAVGKHHARGLREGCEKFQVHNTAGVDLLSFCRRSSNRHCDDDTPSERREGTGAFYQSAGTKKMAGEDLRGTGLEYGSEQGIGALEMGKAYKAETPRLYHNHHDGTFTDVTKRVKLDRQFW